MNKAINPSTVAPPLGRYSHSVAIPANSRVVMVSGQVGVGPDGGLKEGAEAQTEQACRNIIAILEANGMGIADLVKLTTYMIDLQDLAAVRAGRIRVFGEAAPASTLAVIKSLVGPQYLVEIEAIAAKTERSAARGPSAAGRRPTRKAAAKRAKPAARKSGARAKKAKRRGSRR
jgi:enamine deaminase RidA (YjgF/YER057c/UK114 family)